MDARIKFTRRSRSGFAAAGSSMTVEEVARALLPSRRQGLPTRLITARVPFHKGLDIRNKRDSPLS